ncbi:MAG: tetratricopeptide repeat protein [Bryobacteraceae bacterium]
MARTLIRPPDYFNNGNSRIVRLFIALLVACAFTLSAAQAQTPKPGDAELNRAYKALAQKDYDSAVAWFRQGLTKQPRNAAAHKDLAYTLLKAGDDEDARDEFAAAMRLNPNDDTAALEYAFLAFETKKPITYQIHARRIFDRLRHSSNPTTQATAEQAFENIDRPLAEGIARWTQALARSADPNGISTYSAHWELAQLAERRDDLPLAAAQYEICRKLKPRLPDLLLILARVWREMGRTEQARAALLAASRSSDSRTAELALEQFHLVNLDAHYPYPYQFLNALNLDPANIALRRDLAFLYLAMNQKPAAVGQFQQVLAIDPNDRLSREQLNALRSVSGKLKVVRATSVSSVPRTIDAEAMGKKSLALGYTRDAIKYLLQAHEEHPDDADAMLRLGWAYNQVKDDSEASYWFDRARHADVPRISSQALHAYRNLNPESFPQTTIWLLPMYSSRWNDVFTYGQAKRTVPLPWTRANKLLLFYLSTRFDGDVRGHIATIYGPGYLSEGATIFSAGASSKTWHRLMAWGEAGEAVFYMPGHPGRATPDYRGGLHFDKGFGKLLGSPQAGFFYENSEDAEYIRAFDRDLIGYSQHRAGRTFRAWKKSSLQALVNVNYTRDIQRQYWANTLEAGPGLKFHLPWMPRGVYFSIDYLRGKYLEDPYIDKSFRVHSYYNDIRVGFWFARTR